MAGLRQRSWPLCQPLLSRRHTLVALAGAGLLPACGFELRRPLTLPFTRIALLGFSPHSPLAEEFRRSLGPAVQVVERPAQAEVVLHALLDEREKSVVASTTAGQVREVQLRLKFNFRAHTPSGRQLLPAAELLLTRDMSYSETTALAKEYEEAQLYREMQTDVVAQVMQRLSTLRALSAAPG